MIVLWFVIVLLCRQDFVRHGLLDGRTQVRRQEQVAKRKANGGMAGAVIGGAAVPRAQIATPNMLHDAEQVALDPRVRRVILCMPPPCGNDFGDAHRRPLQHAPARPQTHGQRRQGRGGMQLLQRLFGASRTTRRTASFRATSRQQPSSAPCRQSHDFVVFQIDGGTDGLRLRKTLVAKSTLVRVQRGATRVTDKGSGRGLTKRICIMRRALGELRETSGDGGGAVVIVVVVVVVEPKVRHGGLCRVRLRVLPLHEERDVMDKLFLDERGASVRPLLGCAKRNDATTKK